eukprot:668518-Pyramimonas_sp.AAC.1
MVPRNAVLGGWGGMRTAALGLSVELTVGRRNADLDGGDACECSCGLRWRSMWGHEALSWIGERHANCATGTSVGPLWGYARLAFVVEAQANCATGAF